MPTKNNSCRPLLILILLSLSLGIYKVATLRCISNDSVVFLEFADDLNTSPKDAIKTCYQHPGFPAGILLAEKIKESIAGTLSIQQKVMAGQIVNLFCRIVALCFLYYSFLCFSDRRAALINALLVALIPVYADNGSDVLSDWPNLMFMSMAFFCCLRGLSKASAGWFLSAGIASGLAYWVRPEGLFLLIGTAVYVAIHLFHTAEKSKWVSCLLTMSISACLIASPYMYYKGAVFPKKNIGSFSQNIISTKKLPADTCTLNPYRAENDSLNNITQYGHAAIHFIDRTFNSIYLLIIPLFVAVFWKLRRLKRFNSQDQFLAIFIILWLLMMIWLYGRTGYMSHRHIMPMLAFSFAWLYKGIVLIALFIWRKRYRLHRHIFILLGICVAVFLPKLIRPIRTDKAVYRKAGIWLSQNTSEDAQLAVFDNRIGFYAERQFHLLKLYPKRPTSFLIIKSSDQSTRIPRDAIATRTGNPEIDGSIVIYKLPSHQE